MTKMIRDPNCPARDMTKWFGWAFTLDKHAPPHEGQSD
jgi:hypothetical protein